MKLIDFCKWFEDEMEKLGFWDGDKWNEHNDKEEAFEDKVSEVLMSYETDGFYDWDITHEQTFDSSEMSIYATAISVAFYSEENMLSTYSLLYTTYSC